jgi:DNA-binding MarR family transcriptional regulator
MLALWDHRKVSSESSSRSPSRSPLSVKQIAAALQLDSATLSPMLKRLEGLGFVTRARSTTDERATDVELTEAGIELRERALDIPPTVVARLGGDMAELEQLHAALTRINAAALAAGALKP